ncbi:MAG: hypothetical protein E6G35_15240 [Actinobacteria bacterium]|nr:MAG: hypothetical protein E6G35_15240 [Actinomycetota bacterium]
MISRRWILAAGVAVVVWLGVAYRAAPPDAHDYRRDAVSAAQAALAAVRSVALAGQAQQDGKLFDPYLSTVIDDEAGAVASAQQQVLGQPPPDGTRTVRDQLLPLLVQAGREIADLDAALSHGDHAGVGQHLNALHDLGDRLDDFVERYQ